MELLAQNVIYTDHKGHGTARAATVIATPETWNDPEVPQAELDVLAKHGFSPRRSGKTPLDGDRGEVLLLVHGADRDYRKTAVPNKDGTAYVASDSDMAAHPLPAEPAALDNTYSEYAQD